MHLTIEELLQYTEEERALWEVWFKENGEELLKMPVVGERENTIGALILDIFGPEWRFVRRLEGEPDGEFRNRPRYHIDELFGFGLESRNRMRTFIAQAEEQDWKRTLEFEISSRIVRASIRKVVFSVLIHEIRNWAQVSRLMRERGFVPPVNQDLLTSSALV